MRKRLLIVLGWAVLLAIGGVIGYVARTIISDDEAAPTIATDPTTTTAPAPSTTPTTAAPTTTTTTTTTATTTEPPADYASDLTIECGTEAAILRVDYDFVSFLYSGLSDSAYSPDLYAVHYGMLVNKVPDFDARLQAFVADCREWVPAETLVSLTDTWERFLANSWEVAQEFCPRLAPEGFAC